MLYLILFVGLILLDQWTKFWAVARLRGQNPIYLIDNQLSLIYVENRGAAFGILQDRRVFFIVLTTVVILFLFGYLLRHYRTHSPVANLALVLIMAGALGNLIDRIRMGYVVDFIALKFGGLMNFPVFNVADMAVVSGALLLVYLLLFTKEFA